LPTFFPPKRGLGHRAVHRQPFPINALQGLVFSQSLLPQLKKDTSLAPLLEAAMGGTTGTEAGVVQGVPLAPGTQHEEDGIQGLAIIDAGPVAPQRVRLARGQ
jgi:hypothetical protein